MKLKECVNCKYLDITYDSKQQKQVQLCKKNKVPINQIAMWHCNDKKVVKDESYK